MEKQFTAIDRACEQLAAEAATLEGDDLTAYLAKVDAAVASLRDLKTPHQKAMRNAASKASRAKRAARVKEALALLAEQEEAAQKV